MLGAAEQGDAEVSANLQSLAAILELERAAIVLAVVRVEDASARPRISLPFEIPDHHHVDDRFAVPLAGALVANRIRRGRIEEPDDLAEEFVVRPKVPA
jgi:hypothetical protein